MNVLGHASPSPWTRREKIARALWIVVESTLFRWSPRPCHAWRRALLRLFGARVLDHAGPPARVAPSARIHFPWKLELHGGVMVGPDVRLYNLAPITLRRGANLAQGAHLCAGSHDYTLWTMPLDARPIVVEENAWLAAEVFVGPGVTIGELAVIGARSVVMRDQPARMVCAGNPCRPLKPRPDPR
jgi:putative colanic acid biosynthesis acetyltransferase WcaF